MAHGDIRFLQVGPRTMLVELRDLDETLSLFDALVADPVPGMAEVVPAARTLMIRTDPGIAADGALAALILRRHGQGAGTRADSGAVAEISMRYDGADLADVAAHMGLAVPEVIAAHQAAHWQVAFCGFAPGFAYLTCDDPRFDLPRRAEPRLRIPAGSVALAARFGGIYPQDSPGGWQLIGTTGLRMWDLARDPPALLQPGMRVRFVEGDARVHPVAAVPKVAQAPALTVLATAFPILFQDDGRAGQGGQGVSASGAMDRGALHRANRAVGNPAASAALEITLGPVDLRSDDALTLALTGAVGRARIVAGDARIPVAPGQPFALDRGERLLIDPPLRGMRAYLALRGGFRVAPVLGSAATDTLARIGPVPLKAGAAIAAAHAPAIATAAPEDQPPLPGPGDLVELPVALGPRADWFGDEEVRCFLDQQWQVTPESSRIGLRLRGARGLMRDGAELPSEGTEAGAIQIPHTGQPVLFLADHPLTGGYPVIATVLPQALDLAGQIPPGARIRFVAARPFAALDPKGTP